jgi:hypothetical protein
MKTRILALFTIVAALCGAPVDAFSQTSSTGAITGTTSDPSQAVIPGVEISVINEGTGETRTVVSRENGTFTAPLLAPGVYRVQATLPGFKTAVRTGVGVNVTESTTLNIQLEVGEVAQTVSVEASALMVQQESSALGRVIGQTVVAGLPLVTRNYTQILGLSPGISMDVTNAGELGRGTGGTMLGRINVNGSRAYDHNFQVDSTEVNDFETSTGGNTAGVAVPNPDTIQEFKVQTAQYDASFGRNAGANINVVTKSGSNQFHGSLFHFLRNEALNANDFFFNRTGTRKPVVRQNQFGGTVGGPIVKDKLLFFGSYQGTRQITGLAAGKTRAKCSATIFSPALTDDRSPAALGALFAGKAGQNGGTAVRQDGANINPISLQLLQMKLPDGKYLFATPQIIDPTQPFDRQGVSTISDPCTFSEDQYMANVDYLQSDNSKFALRLFAATSDQHVSFPAAANNVQGFPLRSINEFYVGSLAHTYVFSPRLFNEARVGVYRNRLAFRHSAPFTYSDLGIAAGEQFNDLMSISITGSYSLGNGNPLDLPQATYQFRDTLSYTLGSHTLGFGGGLTRTHDNVLSWRSPGSLSFQTFQDFLLGLSSPLNGSDFSNIFSSSWTVGPAFDRKGRLIDGFAYAQDNYKVSSRLTVHAGFRYERMGHYNDFFGVNTNFDTAKADPNPPASGTFAGWVVPSNFAAGFSGSKELPSGVTKTDTPFGVAGDGQNLLAPRIGFAWQIVPNSSRVLLRGGYGVYYTRTVGQIVYNSLGSGPFRLTGSRTGTVNAAATLSNPFPQPIPGVNAFPAWDPLVYSPTTSRTASSLAQNYRPPIVQQYSLNIQVEVLPDALLEVGYAGTRGTRLVRNRSINQARLASPAEPIRGVTTNTVANVAQRVPILGFQAVGIGRTESDGQSWYNSLQTSLTKRMSHGLQFLGSYTWSKNLDSDAGSSSNFSSGPGNQFGYRGSYGRAPGDRAHRFVFSSVYEIPGPFKQFWAGRVLGGWAISGVATIQSGQALTILSTNANNVFGITNDRAQIQAGCTAADLITSGSVTNKLNNYFNTACLTAQPVVGDDGRATAFGNSGVGIVNGPAQQNVDLAFMKRAATHWFGEASHLEFRAEMFNAFNTPQFNDPGTQRTSSAFGQISSTAVSPRIMQLALKLVF